jgi:hypothetical protein
VEPWEPEATDTALILGVLFDIKNRVLAVEEHVVVIRNVLEGQDGGEEAGQDPEP